MDEEKTGDACQGEQHLDEIIYQKSDKVESELSKQPVSEAESDAESAYSHHPSQLAVLVAQEHIDEFAVSHEEFGDYVTSPLDSLVEDTIIEEK